MFKIKENELLTTGICKYKDENGNTVFIRRWLNTKDEDGFTAKLRFKTHPVKVSVFETAYPLDYEKYPKGLPLKLDYPSGYDISKPEITTVLKAFSDLIVHWNSMLGGIKLLECDNKILMKQYPEMKSEEEIQKAKINNLYQYEELSELLKMIF